MKVAADPMQQEPEAAHNRAVYQALQRHDAEALQLALQQHAKSYSGGKSLTLTVPCEPTTREHVTNSKHPHIDSSSSSMCTPLEWILLQPHVKDKEAAKLVHALLQFTDETLFVKRVSALHVACERGFGACVRELLHVYASPVHVNLWHSCKTPLHAVVQAWRRNTHHDEECITTTDNNNNNSTQQPSEEQDNNNNKYLTCFQLLLQAQADPTLVDAAGHDVWYAVCAAGWKAALQALICLTSHPNKKLLTRGTRTPIHAAAEAGHVQVLQLVLTYASTGGTATTTIKKGIVNIRDGDGNTPLHGVCANIATTTNVPAALATARCLLAAGADPNLRNTAGDTALLQAVRDWQPHRRQADLVTMLLDAGAHVNVMEATPVGLHREKILVEAMLRHGRAIQRRQLISRRALHETALLCRAATWTPLHYAAFYGDAHLVQALLLHGSSKDLVQKRDGRGRTPLAVAGLHLKSAVLRQDKTPRLDMAVCLATAHPEDPLPLEGEDFSVAHNFVLAAPPQEEDSAVSALLAAGAAATTRDVDGNLPWSFACAAGADVPILFEMMRAASQDGLYDSSSTASSSSLRFSLRGQGNSLRRQLSSRKSLRGSLRKSASSGMRGLHDAPTGCSIL